MKNCTKDICKVFSIMLVALFIITVIILIKYTPVYAVSLNGKVLGYVKSKSAMQDVINNQVLSSEEKSAIFTTLDAEPTYEFKLASEQATNEEEIIDVLKEQTTTIYKVYAIVLNEEEKTYVKTWEEAENVIQEMKEQYADSVNMNISVLEKYTENLNDVGIVELADAKSTMDSNLRTIKDEQEKIAAATCNGVYFSVKPVTGNITSRFGAVESIRDHTHAGLDIAASNGTPIKATAAGTVSFAGWSSGYGNLVIIDHENGVQTCYGHCSKLYVAKGDTVEAGDKIAAVGSTGNSTGNHLHFEIRVNGKKINPQKYVYN